MSKKALHTAEEAHFLVRVGQWSIERLQQWLLDNMDAQYDFNAEEYTEEFTEWDDKLWDDE